MEHGESTINQRDDSSHFYLLIWLLRQSLRFVFSSSMNINISDDDDSSLEDVGAEKELVRSILVVNRCTSRSVLNDENLGAMLDVTLHVVGGQRASTPVSSYRGGKKSSYHNFRVVTVEYCSITDKNVF
jgi:hypothetical protein